MKLVPQNNSIICKCITSPDKTTEDGKIIYHVDDDLLQYEVVSIGNKAFYDIDLKIGDVILANSTGTKANMPNGEKYVIFNSENIMAKVVN